ncbi:MAG: CPBP family intramembrane metalloprotease, partial [Chloroflexi bacterium]|nr:CPBP family intramembrane metalloprotease [Chloroflexota bacterium]
LIVAAQSVGLISLILPLPVVLSVGLGFVIASIVMTFIADGKSGVSKLLRRFLLWRVGWRWYLTILIVPAINYLAVLINARLDPSKVDFNGVLAYQLFGSSINLCLIIIPWFIFTSLTNLEEISWRGYVLPRLQTRYNALVASLIIGVLWWLWHLPKYMVGGLDLMFVLSFFDVIAKSIMLTWLYNNTKGSLLLVTLSHSAYNTAGVLLPIANTVSSAGQSVFIISSAIELLVAIAIVLIYGPRQMSRTFEVTAG